MLQIAYFVRVALITLIFLPLLGYLSNGPLRPFLEGVFSQEDNWWGMVMVAMVACLTAAAAVTTINLTLWYGGQRFDLAFALDPHRYALWIFFAGLASAAGVFVYVCLLTAMRATAEILAGLVGFLLSAALVFSAKFIQLVLTDPKVTPTPPPYLVFPADRLPLLGAWFNSIYLRPPRSAASFIKMIFAALASLALRLVALSSSGYLVPGRKKLTLLSGHVFATSLAFLSLAMYWLIGDLKYRYVGVRAPIHVPSLAYVLLFIMVCCWLFSGLAFFFDRFRFPVLLAFVLLTSVTDWVPRSDHFFESITRSPTVLSDPATILEKRVSTGHVPVLVAAAGGGIQAAAWSTQVLAKIDQECRQCDLPHSLTLLSGVSGGSVGAMHVGAVFPDLAAAARNSAKSSLDDIAWGWINPDVRRTILPWLVDQYVDRGWALEKSLEGIVDGEAPAGASGVKLKGIRLSNWAGKAGRDFPAFLFNATMIETGAPLIFATTKYQGRTAPPAGTPAPQSFFAVPQYQGSEVSVVTAARLSATFPYVSPAARAGGGLTKQPSWHLVDGGYYDNYGLITLMDWLNDALIHGRALPNKIVILRLVAFPPDRDPNPETKGWGFQSYAPLKAFLSVRETAQADESIGQLKLFEDFWAKSDKNTKHITIQDFLIQYPGGLGGPCKDPPLSWKLTRQQQQCIVGDGKGEAWGDQGLNRTISEVIQSLK
ncbi:MAG: patatin-like phospholipase family protein [Bryobacteraceae bacterium]